MNVLALHFLTILTIHYSHVCKQQTNLTMFLQLIPTFLQLSSFSIKMDAKLDTMDEANDEVVHPPRKAKKADKKKIVTGKASMAPPPLAGASRTAPDTFRSSQRSRLQPKREDSRPKHIQFRHVPGENPRPIPVVWDYPEARYEEYAYDAYDLYDDPRTAQFSQDYDSHRGFDYFTGTGVMTTLWFPSATTRPDLTRPTSAPWHHRNVNMFPSRTSSGRKSTDK
jgi:hypothetical protein